MMQAGIDKWEAAGFLGMTVEMLDRITATIIPTICAQPANAIGYWRRVSFQYRCQRPRRPDGESRNVLKKLVGPGEVAKRYPTRTYKKVRAIKAL